MLPSITMLRVLLNWSPYLLTGKCPQNITLVRAYHSLVKGAVELLPGLNGKYIHLSTCWVCCWTWQWQNEFQWTQSLPCWGCSWIGPPGGESRPWFRRRAGVGHQTSPRLLLRNIVISARKHNGLHGLYKKIYYIITDIYDRQMDRNILTIRKVKNSETLTQRNK